MLNEIEIFFKKNKNVERLLLVLNEDSAFLDLETGDQIIFGNILITADEKFENSWHDSERFFLYWAKSIKEKENIKDLN